MTTHRIRTLALCLLAVLASGCLSVNDVEVEYSNGAHVCSGGPEQDGYYKEKDVNIGGLVHGRRVRAKNVPVLLALPGCFDFAFRGGYPLPMCHQGIFNPRGNCRGWW